MGSDGMGHPSCVCPTCDGSSVRAVCGSDHKSYPSECDMRRSACMMAKDVEILRNSACGKFLLCMLIMLGFHGSS